MASKKPRKKIYRPRPVQKAHPVLLQLPMNEETVASLISKSVSRLLRMRLSGKSVCDLLATVITVGVAWMAAERMQEKDMLRGYLEETLAEIEKEALTGGNLSPEGMEKISFGIEASRAIYLKITSREYLQYAAVLRNDKQVPLVDHALELIDRSGKEGLFPLGAVEALE